MPENSPYKDQINPNLTQFNTRPTTPQQNNYMTQNTQQDHATPQHLHQGNYYMTPNMQQNQPTPQYTPQGNYYTTPSAQQIDAVSQYNQDLVNVLNTFHCSINQGGFPYLENQQILEYFVNNSDIKLRTKVRVLTTDQQFIDTLMAYYKKSSNTKDKNVFDEWFKKSIILYQILGYKLRAVFERCSNCTNIIKIVPHCKHPYCDYCLRFLTDCPLCLDFMKRNEFSCPRCKYILSVNEPCIHFYCTQCNFYNNTCRSCYDSLVSLRQQIQPFNQQSNHETSVQQYHSQEIQHQEIHLE